jgi:O-antigen/teichoic acid export membrane protein
VTGIGANIVRKNLSVMLIALVSCAINLVGNLVLIPLLGATGAAVSTAVAFFAMFVMRTEMSMRQWAGMRRSKLYVPLGVITLLSVLFALTGQRFPVVWIGAWHVCAVVYVVLNRAILAELLVQLGRGRQKVDAPAPAAAPDGLKREG